MSVEILAEAASLIEAGSGVAQIAADTRSFLMPLAVASGALSGYAGKDMKQAAIIGALTGAVLPFFGKGGATADRLAMGILTSAAVGAIAFMVKQSFAGKEDAKPEQPVQPSR